MNTGTMILGIRQVVTAILMFGSCNKSLFNFARYVVLEPRVTVRPDGNVFFQSVSSIGNEWAGFLTVLAVDSKPRNRVPDALITFGVGLLSNRHRDSTKANHSTRIMQTG